MVLAAFILVPCRQINTMKPTSYAFNKSTDSKKLTTCSVNCGGVEGVGFLCPLSHTCFTSVAYWFNGAGWRLSQSMSASETPWFRIMARATAHQSWNTSDSTNVRLHKWRAWPSWHWYNRAAMWIACVHEGGKCHVRLVSVRGWLQYCPNIGYTHWQQLVLAVWRHFCQFTFIDKGIGIDSKCWWMFHCGQKQVWQEAMRNGQGWQWPTIQATNDSKMLNTHPSHASWLWSWRHPQISVLNN